MIALSLMMSFVQSPVQKDVDAKIRAIGRLRGAFGDKPNSREYKYYGATMGGTIVLFPAGRGDTRLYLSQFWDGTQRRRLTCMSKANGKFKLRWKIVFDSDSQRPPKPSSGALENFIGFDVAKVTQKILPEARKLLTSKQAFAMYQDQPPGGGWYGRFIFEDGHPSDGDDFDDDIFEKGKKPWPVTKEERAWIAEKLKR